MIIHLVHPFHSGSVAWMNGWRDGLVLLLLLLFCVPRPHPPGWGYSHTRGKWGLGGGSYGSNLRPLLCKFIYTVVTTRHRCFCKRCIILVNNRQIMIVPLSSWNYRINRGCIENGPIENLDTNVPDFLRSPSDHFVCKDQLN